MNVNVINDGVVLFVGAGVSLPSPSNLPLFGQLRWALLELFGSGYADRFEPLLGSLAPERLLYEPNQGGVPVTDVLGDVLGRGSPNGAHQVIAEAYEQGAIVWTPNADELIEAAWDAVSSTVNAPPVFESRPVQPAS